MKTRKIEPERSVEKDKHFWLNNSNTYSNQMKFRIEVVWCELASIRVLQCGSDFFQISCTQSKKKSNLSFFFIRQKQKDCFHPPFASHYRDGGRKEVPGKALFLQLPLPTFPPTALIVPSISHPRSAEEAAPQEKGPIYNSLTDLGV